MSTETGLRHSEIWETITRTNDRLLKSVEERNLDGIMLTYADDAALLVPGRTKLVGLADIAAGWQDMLDLPGFTLEAQRVSLDVAASEDLAVDWGWYKLSHVTPDGTVDDTGKYLAAWRKFGEEWKMVADMFNTDLS